MFGIITRISGKTDRFRDPRVDEIPMAAFSTTIRKSRSFKVSDQLSHFPGHASRLSAGICTINA
jgi:hypothetical protein